jgi:lysophospholipase L1-like esterase
MRHQPTKKAGKHKAVFNKNRIPKLKKSSFSRTQLTIFIVIFGLIGSVVILRSFAAGAPTPMPLISRSKPAFASSGTASNANDADYSTYWMGSIPGTLAYDLSSVPAGQRGQVLAAWYNDPMTSPYDRTVVGEIAYNSLAAYTIDVNAAAGGGSAPTSGWVTKVTVSGNHLHSRQHLLDMTGYNWIRINVTASDGSSGNTAAGINFDVHSAPAGATDSWMFFGDSITQDGMHHENQDVASGSVGNNFAQAINASNSSYYPAYEDGGIGGTGAADLAANINTWLSTFPGHYVAMSMGTNDAGGNMTTFYNNYATAVNAVINAGKVPIIPTIPASPSILSTGPAVNAQIQNLYNNFPQIIHGPDFWTYFSSHQSQFRDGLHPNAAGYAAMRSMWASTMISAVYTGAPDTTPPVISSVSSGSITSSGATITWTTDENSDSQVEYGTTASYGNSTTLNTSMVTSHSVNLTSLTASTTYHYRVKSKDASGNLATGSDNTFTTSSAGGGTTGVKVVGNQLQKDGSPFIFHGVNRSGTEYMCIQGAGIFDSDVDVMNDDSQVPLMKSWGINSVLIPINEDCWLGINGVPAAYAGNNYINAIKHEVATLEANGMVPIVSLMWTASGSAQALDHDRMVDNSHGPQVWQSMANTFKTDPYVVFRLKQEPHDIGDNTAGWQCLMLGDVQYDTSNTLTPVSSTAHCTGLTSFSALGMQSMINIVRGTGANNVIAVSGTEYSNSMTHFMDAGIRPSDPLAVDQLMGAVDTYPFGNACGNVTCYNNFYAPVAAAMPFISGEMGEDPACARTNMTEVDAYMTWLDQHNSGYLAWAWDTWGGSCQLISSYVTGAAKSPWGVDYKAHLASLSGGGDTTAPTVSITAPTNGATVSGSSVSVTASASDNVGVVGVQFKLDGANLSSEDTTSPYSVTWDSTTASNGTHTLTAVARDAAGNTTTSTSVTVTVSNGGGTGQGDLNGDGHVNILDLSILLSHYGQAATAAQGDINNDGTCNILDLSILLSHYGT